MLLSQTGANNYPLRTLACKILGKIGGAQAIELLGNVLADSRQVPFARSAAADALADTGDPTTLTLLLKALDNDDWYIRLAAATALGKLNDARAVEALARWIFDEHMGTWAVRSLAKFSDMRVIDPLIKALNHSDENARKEAAIALSKIGDARAIAPLCESLGTGDLAVASYAATALEILVRKFILNLSEAELQLVEQVPDVIQKKYLEGDSPMTREYAGLETRDLSTVRNLCRNELARRHT